MTHNERNWTLYRCRRCRQEYVSLPHDAGSTWCMTCGRYVDNADWQLVRTHNGTWLINREEQTA